MKKRIGLIMAREMQGFTKRQIANESKLDSQRYQRIEADQNVKVDLEEAYRIANALAISTPMKFF